MEQVPKSSTATVVGAPVTPVSYAGMARRSTVGFGGPASGVGVLPGAGEDLQGRGWPMSRKCLAAGPGDAVQLV